jgi:hypothetical protein
MGKLTQRARLVKQDITEPADIDVYNDNMDLIHNEVMSVPFVDTLPGVENSWPGKFVLRDSGDPDLFLPEVRVFSAVDGWKNSSPGTWRSYNPEGNNITLGNGSLQGRYCHMGNLAFVEILFIVGSTTSFAGTNAISFSPPTHLVPRVPPNNAMRSILGTWMARCGGGSPPNLYKGRVMRRNTNVNLHFDPRTMDPTGALVLHSTRPNTWTTGNVLFMQVSYESSW